MRGRDFVFARVGKTSATFAANGYDALSMMGFGLPFVFLIETVLTGFFLIVIIAATSKRAPLGFAPIAIGVTLTAAISMPSRSLTLTPPSIRHAPWGAVWRHGGAEPGLAPWAPSSAAPLLAGCRKRAPGEERPFG